MIQLNYMPPYFELKLLHRPRGSWEIDKLPGGLECRKPNNGTHDLIWAFEARTHCPLVLFGSLVVF